MSSLVIGPLKEHQEFEIPSTDLIANHTIELICETDGFIDQFAAIVQDAVTTGGTITLQGGGAVYNMEGGLDTTSFPNPAQGDTPQLITPGTSTAASVSASAFPQVSYPNHGLPVGAPVSFTGGSVPTGMSLSTQYYVADRGYSANGFDLTTTPGGGDAGLLSLSGSNSSGTTINFGAVGTIPVTNCQLTVPNSATAGSEYVATQVPVGDNTNLVKAGQLLQIVLSGFATAGAMRGYIRYRTSR